MPDNCYDKLRSLGVSVETADAIAPILAKLPEAKREAFYLWACGMKEYEVARECNFSLRTVERLVRHVRVAVFSHQR
jgi:DNA-directed RNA polymerase specialized sigma24 family protein